MDDFIPEKPSESKVRKTVTLTQKQFMGSGGVIAALLTIQPLTNMFLTNDKAETMRTQIHHLAEGQAKIEAVLASNKAELSATFLSGNKLILDSIRAAEERTSSVDKRHDRLIERLQFRLDGYEASVNNRSTARKTN